METVDDGVVIKIDGELFTKYITKGEGDKPYFWPIIGPTGKKMTRAYPMEDVEGEKQDHPHHRSMWFGEQDINGFDTWHERRSFEERFAKKPEELEKALAGLGSTRHDEVVTAKVEKQIDEINPPSPTRAPEKDVSCKKFIPSAGLTVSVPCGE